MTEPVADDLKSLEDRKREAAWDPAQRWRVLQETIAWADSQAAVPRNTRRRCLELQRARLAADNP
jgi:hypothetical protein